MIVPICPSCGYDLSGLKPGRCPECGDVWSPDGVDAESRRRQYRRVTPRVLGLQAMVYVLASLLGIARDGTFGVDGWFSLPLGLVLAGYPIGMLLSFGQSTRTRRVAAACLWLRPAVWLMLPWWGTTLFLSMLDLLDAALPFRVQDVPSPLAIGWFATAAVAGTALWTRRWWHWARRLSLARPGLNYFLLLIPAAGLLAGSLGLGLLVAF